MKKQDLIKRFEQIDLYPVTCEALSNGRTNIEILHAAIKGGAKIIQLREKELPRKKFMALAKKFREITLKHNVLFIINDHIDIAIQTHADGVHLGSHDMTVKTARHISQDILIGASVHNVKEAIQAEKDGADYLGIGPIFPTGTKTNDKPIGFGPIKEILKATKLPCVAIGGIDLNNIDQILSQGIKKAAVITAITQAKDPIKATKDLIKKIR